MLHGVRGHGWNHVKCKVYVVGNPTYPLKQPYKSYKVPLLTFISGTSYDNFADEKMVNGNLQ